MALLMLMGEKFPLHVTGDVKVLAHIYFTGTLSFNMEVLCAWNFPDLTETHTGFYSKFLGIPTDKNQHPLNCIGFQASSERNL